MVKTSAKAAVIADVRAQVAGARLVVVLEHRGVDGPTGTALRRALTGDGWTLRVVKARLARRALADGPVAPLASALVGPCALFCARARDGDALRALSRAIAPHDREPAEAWTKFDPLAWRRHLESLPANHPRKPRPGATLRIRGGWWDGALWSPEALLAEAALDRAQVHAELIGVLAAPAARLVALLRAR